MRAPRYSKRSFARRQGALSLAEFLVVISILGILALAALPDSSPVAENRLDLAAAEIAQALRFARGESLRSGEYYGVTISQVTQQVTVKKWDVTTDPASTELIPYHPVSKRVFEFNAGDMTLTGRIAISNTSDAFLYETVGRRRSLIFDPRGVPLWSANAGADRYRLLDGRVELSDGSDSRQVSVAPLTGRVAVQ